MRPDDLRDVVHQADADVAEATRSYLASLEAEEVPPTAGLIVLNRTELLAYLGYLSSGSATGTEVQIARGIELWVQNHDLTDEFERNVRG